VHSGILLPLFKPIMDSPARPRIAGQTQSLCGVAP
jgi:hypothetical protein